jgi:hypothetical protein
MLLNNWGGISHKVMEFHEYVNLFSGKSGSGKSTVMDAIQVVLYGSVASAFLNKAADDAKNKRSVLSYLRGAQKDGTFNRADVDFCSHIVLEIYDTGSKITTCIGVIFEVGRNDLDLKKYHFFSHCGKIPQDEYLTNQGTPYTTAQLKNLIEERKNSEENRGRGDVNRIYPSKEAYLGTLYDVIFGYIDPGRLMTMEKSAIALRMTNGTGQFIRDYMFPKSKEDTVATISEQLGAYREIKERVEDLEQRIDMLDEIHSVNLKLVKTQTDKVRTQAILKMIELESCKAKIKNREEDLHKIVEKLSGLTIQKQELASAKKAATEELIEVKAQIQSSDYGLKKKELEDLEPIMNLMAGQSRQWREILNGLAAWDQDETVSEYISNPTLQALEGVQQGTVTQELLEKLKKGIQNVLEIIEEELADLNESIRENTRELNEKTEMVEDLKHDRKPYRKELKSARAQLQTELSSLYGHTVHVEIFADLFDITDEKWKDAIEGRLGRIKHSLITEPQYALDAAKVFRKMKRKEFEEVELINTKAIQRDQPQAQKGTLYEAVKADQAYVDLCLKRYLGRIFQCESVEELHEVRDGVTPDCYSYSNYIFRHLREADYNRYACIGTKVSKARLQELEQEVYELQKRQIADLQLQASLKQAQKFEQLNQSTQQLLELSKAAKELEKYLKKQEQLRCELKELADGTLNGQLRARQEELEQRIANLDETTKTVDTEYIGRISDEKSTQKDLADLKEKYEGLKQGFVENEELLLEVREHLGSRTESVYRSEQLSLMRKLEAMEEQSTDERSIARNHFNHAYPAYGFTGVEHENDAYDKLLEKLRLDFEPRYKEEFEKQYRQVYHSLRDNVIATIHGEIKAAYRHKQAINRMLSKIRFSDSTYQIDILPAQNENGQFYEMLMAPELDSKVPDNDGVEGQLSFGDDSFYQKYEKQILRLTEKFMPPRDEDGLKRTLHKQEMEQYVDYRNYLTFSMYERVEDEQGNVKKNAVDEMAGRDSGGEGQNPKYVALLAGFAMLYMQQSNRDSKIRLVLLDEAFSKMDKERSEVCLRYARELELQLIVCVPDERLQSLIRNVDSVYGFRRYKNQISMMHIDKGDYLEMLEGEQELLTE